ncbi:hypothetical protein RFI_21052 [Reticulomyxa filosa]|uniref:t-SNARE coiled-coil homology domain-containing protein n=1 Tax=Reticulomyxa filosa TaxID=46433 RepID=X6MS69_RETFI|nr:hypothetical protein RFI_21052 [Reticulomyxa filosa]|eukprot:ETO16302.1 hypothetical protein RFI_21052 [Reticulomyxa filosa]
MSAQEWMHEFEEIAHMARSAKDAVDSMNQCERKNQRQGMMKYKRLARAEIKKIEERIPQLKSDLNDNSNLSTEEYKRRSQMLKKIGQECKMYREQLQGNKYTEHNSTQVSETVDTAVWSNEEMRQMHEEKIRQHDDDLEALLQGTRTLQSIGNTIQSELERQSVVMDDIETEMDTANSKLDLNIKRTDFLYKKSMKDKGCCCLMLFLFVVLLLVIFW